MIDYIKIYKNVLKGFLFMIFGWISFEMSVGFWHMIFVMLVVSIGHLVYLIYKEFNSEIYE